jgi:hypothetical protein
MNILCYFVASVISLASLNGVNQNKFEFGVRQMTEDLISDKFSLCPDGNPIEVQIISIEAPTKGIQVGPFEFKQKKTIVTTKVLINGKEYIGVGTNKTTASSTLLQLQDENLPFEQTEFSVALKKSLENALTQL